MTDIAEPTRTTEPMPSFFEDAIEIFVHPADVFRRRANDSFWKPFLFVVITISVIGIATFGTLQPILEAEFTRQMAASNAKMTEAQMNTARDFALKFGMYILPVGLAFGMIILGFATWIVSKMFSAKTTLSQAFVVMAWSYFPRILGSIAGGVQGLVLDPSKLNSILSISLSPARFMDVTTANPLVYQLAGRFDILIIWETILLATGIYVTGKISKNAAIGFGVTIFILGSLQAIRTGLTAM